MVALLLDTQSSTECLHRCAYNVDGVLEVNNGVMKYVMKASPKKSGEFC